MKKSTQSIVKNVSTAIVNQFEANYFELQSTYTRNELYAIAVEEVINEIDDHHTNAVLAKYGKSVKRKSSRLVREWTKTV